MPSGEQFHVDEVLPSYWRVTFDNGPVEHAKGPALADLLSALDGKLSARLDVQVLAPHPSGEPDKGAI
jgi:hypothetical protein